jgi:hypothetical protein
MVVLRPATRSSSSIVIVFAATFTPSDQISSGHPKIGNQSGNFMVCSDKNSLEAYLYNDAIQAIRNGKI